MNGGLNFYLAAVLLLLAALLLLGSAHLQRHGMGNVSRPRHKSKRPSQSLPEYLRNYLLAAGIPVEQRDVVIWGSVVMGGVILLLYVLDFRQGPWLVLIALVLINLLLRLRAATLRRRITEQMPQLLDMLGRDMTAGQGFDRAFRRSVMRLKAPLQNILGRAVNRVDLGQELHESLLQEARIMKSFEIELLATVVSVNQQYGGSVTDVLSSFVTLLRQDEHTRKELGAMTGETRMTAWVLGLTPAVVTGFLLYSNPGFLDGMLESAGGRMALIVAVTLQLSGALIIWRMLKIN